MSTIILAGRLYTFLVTRKSIRSLSIRLRSRRSLAVSAPLFTPDFIVSRFIQGHSDWIIKNSAKISPKKALKSLKKIQILDKSFEMFIKKSQMDSVVIFQEEQKIYANAASLSHSYLKKLLDSKFRSFALSIISVEIQKLSSVHHFKYHRISVRNSSSRFGSCSHQNNLNFNWQIIFLPYRIFLHILLHELTHTIHHNHSSKFWSHLAACDPDWRTNRRYLKAHASSRFIV